jgi:pilus assembly protein Flp/PilA
MLNSLRSLLQPADGQGMAEYGLILALVAVVVIVALTSLGGGVSSTFNSISSAI